MSKLLIIATIFLLYLPYQHTVRIVVKQIKLTVWTLSVCMRTYQK